MTDNDLSAERMPTVEWLNERFHWLCGGEQIHDDDLCLLRDLVLDGLRLRAATVVPVICKCGIGRPMAYVNLPLEFTGKRVRIVEAE